MKKSIIFAGLFGLVIGAGIFTFVLTNAQEKTVTEVSKVCNCGGDASKCTCGSDCKCASCQKTESCTNGSCSSSSGFQGGCGQLSCSAKKAGGGCGCHK